MEKKKIIVTGASGFIGREISRRLAPDYHVIGLGRTQITEKPDGMIYISGCITDHNFIVDIFSKYRPDTVIHCAGIAHQKIFNRLSKNEYINSNSLATKDIALAAARANPHVHFIFLSSVSVYGENHSHRGIKETETCRPSSPYSQSKLNAENSLVELYNTSQIPRLDILRLAPVYDANWSLNLEKRVLSPCNLFYVRFGSGKQRMSVLSRDNLAAFMDFRLKTIFKDNFIIIINVCDAYPCSFNEIIQAYKGVEDKPGRRTIKMPLSLVKVVVLFAAKCLPQKRTLIYSFYNKLANDLVFDNKRMLETGFWPEQTLETVLKKRRK